MPLGVLLGALWWLFGTSWRLLEALGSNLSRSWGDLGPTFEPVRFPIDFLSILVAKRVPPGRPLGSQNGAKIDPKMMSKFKYEINASWKRLGAILGRFGRRVGMENVGFHIGIHMIS